MLFEFETMWDDHLGCLKVGDHRINFSIISFKLSIRCRIMRARRRESLKKLRCQKWIKIKSNWTSANRMSKLNDLNKPDLSPIRSVGKCIDYLGKATVFFKLDASGGYWQVEIDKHDRDKTAFTSHHGHYRFIHTPFGLYNAPKNLTSVDCLQKLITGTRNTPKTSGKSFSHHGSGS